MNYLHRSLSVTVSIRVIFSDRVVVVFGHAPRTPPHAHLELQYFK